jgi:hypothetical protein
MPQQGAYRIDGSNMENNGEKPDIACMALARGLAR